MDGFGVYLHLPYCAQLCPYCDFNVFHLSKARWQDMASALANELRFFAPPFAPGRLRTLYFGGGTPSLAPVAVVEALLTAVDQQFSLAGVQEVTLEADPGTIDESKLRQLRQLGVNRLSLGAQSFTDKTLRTLGRLHSALHAVELIEAARRAGFEQLSVDLIAAVPGQTEEDLRHDLHVLLRLAPEHISVYGLTYEPGTAFSRRRDAGRLQPVAEELEASMLAEVGRALEEAGYRRYEISNFARQGFEAQHNSSYWQGRAYLGVGPGAHSFVGRRRWGGIRDHSAYLRRWADVVTDERSPTALPLMPSADTDFAEELSAGQLLAERLMTGLRLRRGLDIGDLGDLGSLGSQFDESCARAAARGWLRRDGSRVVATAEGLLFADSLARYFVGFTSD